MCLQFWFWRIIDTSDEWIEQQNWYSERRFLLKRQATSDLAHETALKAIENAKLKRRCEYDNTCYNTPDYIAQGSLYSTSKWD